MSFNPLPSSYALRLANLDQEVVATVDIHNENGLLLVKKGFPINQRRADLLLLHKLVKPVEHLVQVETQISGSELFKKLSVFIAQQDDLVALEQKWGLLPKIKPICHELAHNSLIAQKLTVMQDQLPKILRKSLFIGWFSAGLVSAMGRSSQHFKAAFYAGLLHEIGMLHLPPELLHKKGKYSAEEWRNMQAHTVIAAKILAVTPHLPYGVVDAVKQHHERADGSGYPVGSFHSDQCELGQILALADSLQAIRFNPASDRKINLKQLTPILQVCADQYAEKVINVALQELKRVEVKRLSRDIDEYIKVAPQVADLLANLQRFATEVQTLDNELSALKLDTKLRSLSLSLNHFTNTVLRSGVFYEGLKGWLNNFAQLDTEPDVVELIALDEIEVLVREMMFLCNRLKQKIELANKNRLLPPKLSVELIAAFAA